MSEDFGFVEINLAISAVFPYTKMIIELNYHFQSTNQFAQRSFQLHLKKMLKYGNTQQLIYNQRKLKSPSVWRSGIVTVMLCILSMELILVCWT